MDDICDFNNLGATFLTSGNLDDACVMFRGSFIVLKMFLEVSLKRKERIVSEDDEDCLMLQDMLTKNDQFQKANALLVRARVLEDEKLEQSVQDTDEDFSSDPDSDDETSVSDDMSYISSASEEQEVQERYFSGGPHPKRYDNPFVYQRPFFINDHVSFDGSFDEEARFTSAVVLYNLALVEHIRWLSCLTSGKSVDKIIRLYSQAHRTLQQVQQVSSGTARARLAIVNNLGQLHHEIGNFSAAKENFGSLHNIVQIHLSQRQLSHCIHLSEPVIHEEYYSIEEFFLNASILLSSLPAAAA